MRWLLLEKVRCIHKGKTALTCSRVPDSPYSPEVLFIEMMAQTGGLLVGAESDYQKDLLFAKIESASVTKVPDPGTPVEIEARSDGLGPEGGWLEGRIMAASEVIARSKFLLMAVEGITPARTRPITFHDAFMEYFDVRGKLTGSL
ncbi:MAG: hypothetical protein KTQ49_03690 [Candidatus Omnitrophica bacterium]|nr:hypothetical protein [Candidatus Omnitrophota bacterium]